MDLKQFVILVTQLSILCTVFGFGLKATTDDLLFVMRRPGLLIRSLTAMFVVMPIVAVLLVRLFAFRATVEIALVALAISPVPPLLPQRETKAGGHSAYAIGLMATLALVAVVLSPLAVEIMSWVFGSSVSIAPGAVARLALITVLAPLAAGMIVRGTMPGVAASIEKPVAVAARVLLPVAILGLLVVAGSAMWALVGDGTLVAMILFQVIALVTGHLLAGGDPDQAIVLALSTACRHPAIALTLAAATFPEQRFGAAILLYVVVTFITATPYLVWQRRQMRTMATGTSAAAGR